MLTNLNMEVFYPYPPQKVWQVLTNSRALAKWLMENDFEPHVGHKFKFQYPSVPGLSGIIECQVIEIDEPKRLSYTWQDEMMSQPSIVSWTLELHNGGTRLKLQHQELSPNIEIITTSLHKPTHFSSPWESQFKHESTLLTQKVTLPTPTHIFPLTSVGKYKALDSVVLSSLFNGEWDYKLKKQLSKVLAEVQQARG